LSNRCNGPKNGPAAELKLQLAAIRDLQLSLNLLTSHLSPASDVNAETLDPAQLAAMLQLLNNALARRIAAASRALSEAAGQ
jgi:hypothetical protein